MKTTLKWLFGLGVVVGAAAGACYLAHKSLNDYDCDCEDEKDFDFDNDNFYTTNPSGLNLDENKYKDSCNEVKCPTPCGCDCGCDCEQMVNENKEVDTKNVENVVENDYKVVVNEKAEETKKEVKVDEVADTQTTTDEVVDNEKVVEEDANKEPDTKVEDKKEKKEKKETKKKD